MMFKDLSGWRKAKLKTLAAAALLLLALTPAMSPALDIGEGWRFHTGDETVWAAPDFDDGAWKPIEVGTPWEKAGYEEYDGYAWYRLRVVVPEALSEGAYFKHYQKLSLSFGAVDDVDVTYFNGVEVGRTGSVPDDVSGYWDKPRRYDVPAKVVRWGKENVIAVRVFDNNGDGGMYSGPQTLVAPVWQQYTTVEIGFGRGDGIHPAGTPMDLSATILNSAFEQINGVVRWRVESDTWIVEDRGASFLDSTHTISLRPGSPHIAAVKFEPPAAGFYQVTCSFARNGDDSSVSQSMMQGYAPEKMDRPNTAPDDLREFWDEARRELDGVEPQFKLTPVSEGSTPQTNCYLVEMRSLGNVRIRGWFEVPKAPGPHPALLRVPGYTSAMWPSKSIPDMAVLSLNIRGHGNSQDDVPGVQPGVGADFLLRGIGDPKTNFYRGAIMDCLRGVDFVASRPEVDAKRIGITGGSQGGMLSLTTAALDKRIMLCAPDIPFVSDTMKTFRMTHWPGSIIRDWVAEDTAKNTWELATATIHYFDAKNLAGWIECPVFMGIGLQDPVCPAPTNFAGYNQIRSSKEYRVYPQAGHWTPNSHTRAKYVWMRKQFGLVK
jgi:cephalosporin-C deacetylase-like acetyl esterase